MSHRFAVVLLALGSAVLHAKPAVSGKPPKQDLVWKKYIDKQAEFCLTYPAHWIREDAPDGNGLVFHTGIRRYSMPTGEIDVTSITPAEDPVHLIEAHLEGVKRFVRANDVEILERRQMTIDGLPATFTKDRYRDPLEKADWVEEIVFIPHKGTLYRLEMACRADQASRFDAMFARVVNSFSFDCNAKH